MCTHLSFSCQSPLTCSVFPYPPVTAMCLQPFCVTLPFFLCFILSILSIYAIRLPQPLAHSHLVLPASVYTGIFISILFYSRTNFLCSNSSPDSVLLLQDDQMDNLSPFSLSYSPLTGTVWQRLRPLSHLQYSILLPESLSQVPLCW